VPLQLLTEGLVEWWEYWTRDPLWDTLPWELRLFQNDLVPDADTVLADFVQSTFGGYSAVQLARDEWLFPSVVGDELVTTYTSSPQVWTASTGGQLVYGYYLKPLMVGVATMCERFATPVDLGAGGGVVGVLPRMLVATLPP